MLTYHACSKCDGLVRRSRRRNAWEFVLGVFMLPYRCEICDHREMKLRFIDMEGRPKEDIDSLIAAPTDRELEEERKAEEKAAEKAARKAEKEAKKAKGAKAKAAAVGVGGTGVGTAGEEEEELSHQSSTSDEGEE